MELFITVVIGAGIGTGIVEIILKLFLNHWLAKRRFDYEIKTRDKRVLADKVIYLINNPQWVDPTLDLFNEEYKLSDRLETIKESEVSNKLDKFSNACRNSKDAVSKVIDGIQIEDNQRTFLDSQHEKDVLHLELVALAAKMKN